MIKRLKHHIAKRRAAADVARLFTDDLPARPASFVQSPDYRREFHTMTGLLADLEVLADDPDMANHVAGHTLPHTTAPEKSRPYLGGRLPKLALAASLLAAVIVGVNRYYDTPVAPSALDSARYVTRTGEQKTVKLTDGSTITLNTGTQLLVEFFAERRRIQLEQGEAYFDIAKDPRRPLSIDLGARQITVLGTEFNILKTGNEFSLSVVDGVVALHRRDEDISAPLPVLSVPAGETVRVKQPAAFRVRAGMVAKFNSERQELSAHRQPDMAAVHSWRTGILQFKAVPLSDVIQTLNRYSGKQIIIEDPAIQRQKVFATVNLARLDKALTLLEKNMPVQVVHQVDRILIAKQTQNPKPTTQNPRGRE